MNEDVETLIKKLADVLDGEDVRVGITALTNIIVDICVSEGRAKQVYLSYFEKVFNEVEQKKGNTFLMCCPKQEDYEKTLKED